MLIRVKSYGLSGLKGYEITVEADLSKGLPSHEIVGLPDAAIKESRERIRAAVKNCGFDYPKGRIIINLAPADLKKEGALYDLPIAIALLAAQQDDRRPMTTDGFTYIGELALNGDIRPVNGILPMLISARANGIKRFFIPKANAGEVAHIDGIEVYAVENLRQAVGMLNGEREMLPSEYREWKPKPLSAGDNDMKFVKGQYAARRATEIAVAGGHNILYIGPPGAGKSMLAKCVPGIMPDLTFEEALETTKIHSVSGLLKSDSDFVYSRPFRSPHHTVTVAAMAGGGNDAKPGEISLAHNGVLFLDELPEYSRAVLETLRQPLEDNSMSVTRAKVRVEYPSNFMLVASMNPCPCGNYGSKTSECNCTPKQIHRYLNKLSGPLLDRIDIHVEVDNIAYDEITDSVEGESSEAIRERVNRARAIQTKRYRDENRHCNSQLNNELLKRHCQVDSKSNALLEAAFTRLNLSARAYTRILKVARTIADLDGSEGIQATHVAEAIQYRSLDRKYKV